MDGLTRQAIGSSIDNPFVVTLVLRDSGRTEVSLQTRSCLYFSPGDARVSFTLLSLVFTVFDRSLFYTESP